MGLLLFFAALYFAAPGIYFKLLPFFFYFDDPHEVPFGDLRAVMTSIDCWQRGLHTYEFGPKPDACQGFNYSPIWLRLPFLAKSVLPVPLAGAVLALAFLFSLRLLPVQATRGGVLLMVLASVSSACVFAVERANVDVLLYLMCLAGALLLARPWPRRTGAYVMFALAGFLKFYPIVLMGLAVRERAPRLVLIVVLLAAAATGFWVIYGTEMRSVLAGVSGLNAHWGPFSDRYGARQFFDGLWLLLHSDVPPTAVALLPGNDSVNPQPPRWMMPLLLLLPALAVGVLQWRRTHFQPRWQGLTVHEAHLLLVGAVVVAGCFFAGYNIMYRGIFMLLALPGLIAMGRAASGIFWSCLPLGVVYNLWAPTIQHLIQYGAKVTGQLHAGRWLMLADWLAHEVVWWWTMAAFVAVMLQMVLSAPVLQAWRTRSMR